MKSFLATQRALKPSDVYASLLARNQNDLNNVLVLVKLTITISPTTATCERSFSAMNRLKTVLKTIMQQGTLSNLLRVKDQGTVLKEFDPDSAIDQWLLKAKTKRHIFSKPNVTSPSAIHSDTNDGREVEQEQQEDDNMLLMRKKSSDDIVELFLTSTKQSDLLADGDLNKRRIYDLGRLFCAPQVRCA